MYRKLEVAISLRKLMQHISVPRSVEQLGSKFLPGSPVLCYNPRRQLYVYHTALANLSSPKCSP